MKTRLFSTLLLLTILAAPAALAAATTYSPDPAHSGVLFSVRHLFTDVQGKFAKFSGTITYDPAKPETSSVEFTVEAATVDTGMAKRDEHLRSPDFFDAAKYPNLTFKSTKVAAKGKDMLSVTGDFTLRGVTKTITVPVKVLGVIEKSEWGAKAGFSTTFTINRKDYGVSWSKVLDTGNVVVGDEVTITLSVEANGKPQEQKPAAR